MSEVISRALRNQIADEAAHRCGYCLTDQRVSGAQMHIEHLLPKARGGSSDRDNLWLSCAWCNSYKGVQVESADPLTGTMVELFNPRRQDWSEHFVWDQEEIRIIGLTPVGRATVEALKLNNPYIVPARRLWVLAGWHPPRKKI
jgi:hypothetical protein